MSPADIIAREPDKDRIRKVISRQLARNENFGSRQSADHLDVKGFRASQEELSWPNHVEGFEGDDAPVYIAGQNDFLMADAGRR